MPLSDRPDRRQELQDQLQTLLNRHATPRPHATPAETLTAGTVIQLGDVLYTLTNVQHFSRHTRLHYRGAALTGTRDVPHLTPITCWPASPGRAEVHHAQHRTLHS